MARIKLNDHYFIAWLSVVKQINYEIVNNKVVVEMTSVDYTEFLKEYNETLKPVLCNIRTTVKKLASLTSKP